VERYRTDFVRAGAMLSEADKDRLRAMNAELADLNTKFTQNVLKEVNAMAVVVDSIEDLKGLSMAEIAAAARTAEERGYPHRYLLPLLNTSGQPVLASLENREVRRRVHEASLTRGSRGGEFDNREVVSRAMRLRAERAQLLGYPSHAAWVLDDETALTPDAVNRLLADLTGPSVENARREAAKLQAMIDAEGDAFELEPWDWAYFAEKVRRAEFAYDESELRPYLELGTVLERGVFHAANRLFGVTFHERTDLPTYHPDVRVFEVLDADGELLALFLADYYARPSKRGGAWSSSYVSQSRLLGERPVVANHVNVPKPNEGDPTLLTFDEVTTLFHEFGHALHAMFSDVMYPRFAGTSVPRDFVEFPSQVNEMWATWPEVVASFAVHHETGEPMPSALVEKVLAIETFNQGFATTGRLSPRPGVPPARAGGRARGGPSDGLRGGGAARGGHEPGGGSSPLPCDVLRAHLRRVRCRILCLHLGRSPRCGRGRMVPGERRSAKGERRPLPPDALVTWRQRRSDGALP
jgi:peptidyl-dipeptidase Dcp